MVGSKKALNRDLLYYVAEVLMNSSTGFCFNIDTQAKVVKFMLVNKDCLTAFLSFFSKTKEIDICARLDGIEVDFYKSRTTQPSFNWSEEEKMEFSGPYRGDPWFLAFLVKNGKFNPKKILFQTFSQNHVVPVEPIDKQTTALHSLCMLLNLDGFFNFSHNRQLSLDFLEISNVSSCPAKLQYYLALNAIEVKINVSIDGFHCFPEMGCARINSSKTQTLEIMFATNDGCTEIQPLEFPTSEWIELFTYIFSSCPNLKKLHVRVDLNENMFYYTTPMLDNIHTIIKAMNDEVLPKFEHIRQECLTEFNLHCFVQQRDLEKMREDQSQHELLKMGDGEQVNELEIARVIKLDERASIRFSIYGTEEEENSDGYRDFGDAYDDYDNYGEYDGEEAEDFDDYDEVL